MRIGKATIKELIPLSFSNFEGIQKKSIAKAEWEHEFEDIYFKNPQCLILVVSPPGMNYRHSIVINE